MAADISRNRKALRDYNFTERFEAGIELRGTEVKAIRGGLANLNNAYARVEGSDLMLYDLDIQPYDKASHEQHEPKRKRRLLLHRREIDKIFGFTTQDGYALVAIRMYWKGPLVKVEIGVGRGKQARDKRDDIKARTAKREAEREVARFNKGR